MTEIDLLLADDTRGLAADQRVRGWHVDAWRTELSTTGWYLDSKVPSTLETLGAENLRESGISRAAVLMASAGDPLGVLVASMAWGFGPKYGPSRVMKMVNTPGIDLEETLATIAAAAQAGTRLAWPALFSNGKARIEQLSVAMGSKYLYFAANGPSRDRGVPLVYDKNVHLALTGLSGGLAMAPNPDNYVSTDAYEQYVSWADDKAAEHGLRSDDVEYRLFAAGLEMDAK
jgi:hypothetical protein